MSSHIYFSICARLFRKVLPVSQTERGLPLYRYIRKFQAQNFLDIFNYFLVLYS